MQRPILSLVTDRRLYPAGGLVPALTDASRAGVTLIQIREPDLDDRSLLVLVRQVMDAVDGSRTCVVVNDRADVAMAAGADGVHLRGDSVAASRIRRIVPREFLVGRSVHGIEDAVAAERDGGCDYLTFGTVFASASKPAEHVTAGLAALAAVCRAVTLPVVAIGGITAALAPEVARAGASGLAAIGVFALEGDRTALVRTFERAFDTSGRP